jgi:hypothetical protein
LDVEALYPNIPNKEAEGMEAARLALYMNPNKVLM